MALTKDEKQKLDETHDKIIQITTVLLGSDGYNGLVGDIKQNSQAILALNEKHNSLNHKFWILTGILAGSGVLGSGLWAFLQA